jgi:polyhydroxyalkanoate synthesis regulator phasin
MPAAKKSPAGKPTASKTKASKPPARTTAVKSTAARKTAAKTTTAKKTPSKKTTRQAAAKPQSASELAERLIDDPLSLVMLTRDRIQETLDDAAQRGRVTRSDANDLVAELVRRGRQQTDDLLAELEQLLGRGRGQLDSATKRARRTEPVDRLVRTADRARRTVRVGPSFPILGYDDLTAGQVTERLSDLKPADLRQVGEYERRHANRKSVLDAVAKGLA